MADQTLSIEELAKTISSDIVGKLKLSSGDAVNKSILKELQNLASSNKLLAKTVETSEKKDEASVKQKDTQPSSNITGIKLPDILSSIQSLFNKFAKKELDNNSEKTVKPEEPKSELEKIEKPKDVRIIGFDETAIKSLGLSEVIGKPVENLVKTLTDFKKGFEGIAKGFADLKGGEGGLFSNLLPKGALLALTGAAGILGGIGMLVEAWNTQGPEKGTLETLGKVGLKGGLIAAAKLLFKSTTEQVLKRIPIIGTLISYGFAWQAFQEGDVPRGILEIASGTLGLLDLVAPGLGTALSLGVDVLNAVLDVKAGGSSAEAGAKKTEILKEWAKSIKDQVLEKMYNIPILGDFIKIGESLVEGNKEKALDQLTVLIPALHWVKTVVRSKTALNVATATLQVTGNILTIIGDWISEKISKLFSPILNFFTKNQKTALAEAEKAGQEILPKAKGILTPIKEAIVNIGKNIITRLERMFSPLLTLFGDIGEGIAKKGTWLLTKAKGLLSPIGEGIERLAKSLTNHLKDLFNPVRSFFKEIGEDILKKGTWMLDKAKGLLSSIGEGIERLAKTLTDHIESLFKPVKTFFKEIGEEILKKGTGLLDNVKGLLSPIGEGIEKLAKTLTGHLESLFNPVKSFFIETGETIIKKGTGLLDNAKGLLSPLTEGIEKLGKTVLEHLDDMFKPIKGFLGDIAETLSKKASSFVAPITEIVESIGSKLFSLGDDVFKVFRNMFGSMFGAAAEATVEGVAGKSLLGKLTGFLPKFLGNVGKFLKELPFIGSIISIGMLGTRLMSSDGPDWVGAAIEALSIISGIFLPGTGISLALDILNGVLDYQAEPGEDGKKKSKIDILGKWVSDAGDWLYEKLVKVPYIGPMIEVGKLIATDPIGALKALGDTFPVLGSVVNMFESTFPNLFQGDTSSVGFTDIFTSVGKWAYDKIKEWPVVGPLVKAWGTFASDPVGVLKTLGTVFPVLDKILSFFGIKSEITDAGLEYTGEAVSAILDFKKITKWIWEKILDFPLLGPLIKGLQEFAGDPIGVLRGLGESIPVIKNILSFFDAKTELKLPDISFQFKNPFSELNDKVTNKVKDWWDKATGAISELNPFKDKEKEIAIPKTSSEVNSSEPSAQAPAQAPVQVSPRRGGQIRNSGNDVISGGTVNGDTVIDPNGGLLVSSPKVGSLYQLNKQDGIVAAPIVENKVKESNTSAVSFGKAEAILERIASNTATSNQNISNLIVGFNNLAKALERSFGETAKIPVVVNNTSNQGPIPPTSSQYANAGNDMISNFRTVTVEGSRFRPA